ncbi:MAG: DUF1987 domain-containing protein [Treponema sp.]|nr:DUF1987 domain-containing protein [Treponema sp.]
MAFLMEREKTASTPYVLIDEKNGYIKLEGRCFHEKIVEFFSEIFDWLNAYLASDFSSLTFDCAINYFNSSTTKLLFNMLLKMDKYANAQNRIMVNWITTEDNHIMVECGRDFQEEVSNLEFNLVIN